MTDVKKSVDPNILMRNAPTSFRALVTTALDDLDSLAVRRAMRIARQCDDLASLMRLQLESVSLAGARNRADDGLERLKARYSTETVREFAKQVLES